MTNQTINRRHALQTGGLLTGAALLSGIMPKWAVGQSENALQLLSGVTWIRQSGFRIDNGGQIIYLDPYQVSGTPADADLILVTHPHQDHCDVGSMQRIAKSGTQVVAEADCVQLIGSRLPNVKTILLGDEMDVGNAHITTLRSYNNTKTFHPKSNDWLGFIVTLQDGRTVYHGGDTDFITEMEGLQPDVAMLPIGGNFTMGAVEAADAIRAIQPKLAVPMHWGGSVGTTRDAQTFESELANEFDVLVMAFGQSIPVMETAVKNWERN